MSARTPLVSILVPAYNAARFLPGLCQSIQAQTYPHYEVIIGDDGSSDNTASVMAPFLQDNRFQLLRWQPNRGLAAGIAILYASVRGEYWCATGADDLFLPAFLEKRVETLEANPRAFLVHGQPELMDESGGPAQVGYRALDFPAQLSRAAKPGGAIAARRGQRAVGHGPDQRDAAGAAILPLGMGVFARLVPMDSACGDGL